jgi:hypothetical protein
VLAIIVSERPPEQKSEYSDFEKRELVPQVLNLPSGLIQLPYVMLNPSKQERVPVGLDLMTWRVISWPLLGLVFWWSAGRGIDALLSAQSGSVRPAISYAETAIGFALFLFCLVAAICFPIFVCNSPDPVFPCNLFAAGFGLWAVLAGIVVAARFVQWRLRKRV